MKKILPAFGCAALLAVLLTACGAKGTQEKAAERLGLDVSSGTILSSYDTHSGNGDGMSCTTYHFDGAAVRDAIRNSPDWQPFPLDETAQAVVYGVSNGTDRIGPYLGDREGNPIVPEIQNGFYLLIDRQAGAETPAGRELLLRPSLNLTLGLYDTDTDTFYFCELDT